MQVLEAAIKTVGLSLGFVLLVLFLAVLNCLIPLAVAYAWFEDREGGMEAQIGVLLGSGVTTLALAAVEIIWIASL